MKTYKVVTVRGGWFKETASANLEATLNAHAAEGWRVVNSLWLTGGEPHHHRPGTRRGLNQQTTGGRRRAPLDQSAARRRRAPR